MAVMFTACGSSGGEDKPTAQKIALEKIEAYAQDGGTLPVLQDYLDAGVKGITEENLAQINEAVEYLTAEDVDTAEEIQALADDLGIVLPDTTAPVITLKGLSKVSVELGKTYTDAGATAKDDVDGNVSVSVKGTVDTDNMGTYTIVYIAADSAGNTATAVRTVRVTTVPVFTSSNTASVNENQTSAITLVATDASTVTYSIAGTDAASFDVNASTGVVTFKTAPDFETKKSYTFTATATDSSGDTSDQTVMVTILDVCEAGAVTITHNGTDYKEVCSPYTGKAWLDRNLGAARVCEQFDDDACYGDYYQWGRSADGHENSMSDANNTLATQMNPVQSAVQGKFIRTVTSDWVEAGVDDNGSKRVANWSRIDGTSVCPVGFRVPTIDELKAETLDATDTTGSTKVINGDTAFTNFLKLPSSGYRLDGLNEQNLSGYLWSSTSMQAIEFDSGEASSRNDLRTYGESIRCLKD